MEAAGDRAAGDHAVAADVAARVGRELQTLRRRLVQEGAVGADIREQGDRTAHDLIVRMLAERCPRDAVLSEEGADPSGRLQAHRVWIVDPLDGSAEFGRLDSPDWAVHVALVVEGSLVAGAVALPTWNVTFATGVSSDPPPLHRPLRLLVSPSRPPANAPALAARLGAELVGMGSAGAKAMAVLRGDAAAYVHSGGQYEWDTAAPVAVARAAGLHASRIDGSPLIYNQPDPFLPDVVICHPALAEQVLGAVASLN